MKTEKILIGISLVIIGILVSLPIQAETGQVELFTYTCDVLPTEEGWIQSPPDGSSPVEIIDGKLHITANGSIARAYRKDVPVTEGYINVAEFDLKMEPGSDIQSMHIRADDDKYNMFYTIGSSYIQSRFDDGVSVKYGESYSFDTTTQFNTYKIFIEDGIAKLYINGALAIEQPAGDRGGEIPRVYIGVPKTGPSGEAYFDEIRAYQVPISVLVEDFLSNNVKSSINGLPESAFKNNADNRKNALSNKIDAVISIIAAAKAETDPIIQDELLNEAISELQDDILGKTDGCFEGQPNNDWITDCDAQNEIYPLIMDAISKLQNLI